MEAMETNRLLIALWVILGVILLLLLLVNQGYAGDRDFYEGLTAREKAVARHAEKKYLNGAAGAMRFRGDTEIGENEIIDGDVVVLDGTLTVAGKVDGRILVVFGDLRLLPTASVAGDVIAVNGQVQTDDGAMVEGDAVVTSMPVDGNEPHRESEERRRTAADKPHWTEDEGEVFYAEYSRVNGLTLGLQFPKPSWWDNRRHHFAVIGKGGYSFASKTWQYRIGLERWSGRQFRFAVGADYHDVTDTEDRWIICPYENSAAAFFIKEDFYDYYRRNGYSVWISQNFTSRVKLTAAYRSDDLYNLANRTNWALFGKNKTFRANPPALPFGYSEAFGWEAPLSLNTLSGTLTIDTRNDRRRPTRGWLITAFGERSGDDLNSPMTFKRCIVDIAHYLPLNWDEHLTFRLRGGTANGILPPLYQFDLGGLSTLRGYRFKEFTGDRLVLGNAEYHLRASDGNFLGLDLILFVDSGLAWFVDEENAELAQRWPVDEPSRRRAEERSLEEGFERLKWSSLKTDVGIGLADSDGDFRIDVARRIDRSGGDFTVTFRLCRTF